MTASDELTFHPPGPGTWHHETLHFPNPLTRYFRGLYPPAMQTGTNRGFAEYGLLSEVEIEVVDGYWYSQVRPIVPDPPRADVWSEVETDPEAVFDRRVERMQETFETRRWRSDLERWDDELEPDHRDTILTLQAVDPAVLDDVELLEHVDRCRGASLRGAELHHRMSVTWGVPVGDFLAHATEWTDRPVDDLLGLLDGASPESAGAVDELEDAVAAIEDDDSARRILFSDAASDEILERLRDRSGRVGAALERWLELAGYRLASGYDLSAVYALERPEVLVRTLRTTLEEGGTGAAEHGYRERIATIREEVPAENRDRFDDLFAEARRIYRLRDEREIDLWTLGLMRRALLEVGRRLADRGRLHDREHVVDLAHDELRAAFRDGSGPSAGTVAERAAYRTSHGSGDAPDRLGPDPTDPYADLDLPEPSARARRARDAIRGADHPERAEAEAVDPIHGYAASPGTYEGTARLVTGPDDFAAIEEGDVLVAEVTSTTFNVVLPLLGAIVTDTGGMLSHPAIVAREFGIPAVVGCEDATDRIEDGDRIVVDGEEGTVRFAS